MLKVMKGEKKICEASQTFLDEIRARQQTYMTTVPVCQVLEKKIN